MEGKHYTLCMFSDDHLKDAHVFTERILLEYGAVPKLELDELKKEGLNINDKEQLFQYSIKEAKKISEDQIKINNNNFHVINRSINAKSTTIYVIKKEGNVDIAFLITPLNTTKREEVDNNIKLFFTYVDIFRINHVILGIADEQATVSDDMTRYVVCIKRILNMFIESGIQHTKPRCILLNGPTGHNIIRTGNDHSLYDLFADASKRLDQDANNLKNEITKS